MEIFLKAKHWQLFILMYGLPFGFQIYAMSSMFAEIARSNHPDPMLLVGYFKVFPLIMLIYSGLIFGWYWAVATGLQERIPEVARMKMGKFKICFFIPVAYLLVILAGITVFISKIPLMAEGAVPPDIGAAGSIMALIVPVHLFSIFCIFYLMYFAAKTIKTAGLQRETEFSDFVGEFFLIWFFPIGIWIVQPKINKMIEEDSSGDFQGKDP